MREAVRWDPPETSTCSHSFTSASVSNRRRFTDVHNVTANPRYVFSPQPRWRRPTGRVRVKAHRSCRKKNPSYHSRARKHLDTRANEQPTGLLAQEVGPAGRMSFSSMVGNDFLKMMTPSATPMSVPAVSQQCFQSTMLSVDTVSPSYPTGNARVRCFVVCLG